MKKIKLAFVGLGIVVLINGVLTTMHILQNGPRRWEGKSIEQILNMPAEKATVADIEKLSKAEIMQLFYAASAPEFSQMKGEYKSHQFSNGILGPAVLFYAHKLMGPGHWEGKAFLPVEERKGWGYNLWTVRKGGGDSIVRAMKMDTFLGKSRFDDKASFHLVYKDYNKGRNHTMRDEIRKINDRLFIGLGCMEWNLDTLNPAEFLLYGEPGPWVGLDADRK
jgi:hypothetical protein